MNHRARAGSQQRRLVIPSLLMSDADSLPDDIETLQQLVRAQQAELARVHADVSSAQALIAHLQLAIGNAPPRAAFTEER